VAQRIDVDFDDWPYPALVAHRGAGKLAPENTLAAFRLGAQHGYRMFECDVRLSADGVPFLLHDDRLERTTDGVGMAGDRSWDELGKLDAGRWHSDEYGGEPVPRLEDLARWVLANRLLLDVEIKPSPGTEAKTGETVAGACAALWQDHEVPPLLTSFKVRSLEAARDAVPWLPRGLLVNELWEGWLATAQRLQCVAVVLKHTLVDVPLVRQVHGARMRVGVYTPNDTVDVARAQAAGVDMVVTDAIDVHQPR
jgi:glycerophosphoryl diester phosphodiesterase